MTTSPKDVALQVIAAMSAKNLEGMLALFADDASFFDPHYPTPLMQGKDAIRGNMAWALGFLREMHWTVLRSWESADSVVLEVDTRHVGPDGSLITPPQVFVVDVKDGQVTRWQSFVPYPPPMPPPA